MRTVPCVQVEAMGGWDLRAGLPGRTSRTSARIRIWLAWRSPLETHVVGRISHVVGRISGEESPGTMAEEFQSGRTSRVQPLYDANHRVYERVDGGCWTCEKPGSGSAKCQSWRREKVLWSCGERPPNHNRRYCQCHCGCRKRPGRREACDYCGCLVGPCCIFHEDAMRCYCHWCRAPNQDERGGIHDSKAWARS